MVIIEYLLVEIFMIWGTFTLVELSQSHLYSMIITLRNMVLIYF